MPRSFTALSYGTGQHDTGQRGSGCWSVWPCKQFASVRNIGKRLLVSARAVEVTAMGQRCHGGVTVALCLVCSREVTRCFLTSSPSPGLRRRDHALHWLVATGFAPAAEAFEGDAACIREAARMQTLQDPVLAPSLLRLAFHDAATRRQGDSRRQGPNGSIRFELMRDENYGPSMAAALAAVENIVQRCRVSWADAIAVSGAAVVEAMGGPVISVETGRSDATEPDNDKRLPDGTLTSGAIRDYFRQLGMSDAELVALLGAHTVPGQKPRMELYAGSGLVP